MQDFAILLYVVAVGFVAAGILSSFTQLVSGQPLGFGFEGSTLAASIGGVFLRTFAGPAILMRNAILGARAKAHSPAWLGLSALIAGVWSLFLGLVLLDLVLKL
jgi:hypothetical protein